MASSSISLLILFIISLIAANLPFITDKRLFIFSTAHIKSFWFRFLEWFLMYLMIMLLAIILELKFYGESYLNIWEVWNFAQFWEFYFITICLFVVFALPGFLYLYDLKKYLK